MINLDVTSEKTLEDKRNDWWIKWELKAHRKEKDQLTDAEKEYRWGRENLVKFGFVTKDKFDEKE